MADFMISKTLYCVFCVKTLNWICQIPSKSNKKNIFFISRLF